MSKDFYEVLGVGKSSSQEEIKSAYKKMAIKHHPDRNQDNKEACEKKMKEINEAYETLRDPDKRAGYDRFGTAGAQGNAGHSGGHGGFSSGGFSSFEDLFEDINSMFGGGRSGGQKRSQDTSKRGSDLRYTLKLTLQEVFLGTDKEITFSALGKCEPCSGKGGDSVISCTECGGSGAVRYQQGFFVIENTCQKCNGHGSMIKNPCKSCKGAGRTQKQFKVDVKIPKGVKTGDNIRVDGKGEAGLRGGRSGDLFVAVQVESHQIFTRDGDNLTCEVPIKITKAMLGGEIAVPTIEGPMYKFEVPAGVQNGKLLKVAGKGMSKYNSSSRGDLVIKVKIEIPVNLTSEQKALIKSFDDTLQSHSHPETDGFLSKIKKFFA